MNFGHEGGSSDSSSITSEHWRVSMDEADNFPEIQAEKQSLMKNVKPLCNTLPVSQKTARLLYLSVSVE